MKRKRGWTDWNVGLWIANDEPLYREAKAAIRFTKNRELAAKRLLERLTISGMTHTPDGARYTVTSIRKALAGL